jgi:hypothetical protein
VTNLLRIVFEMLAVVRVEGRMNAVCGGNADDLLLMKWAGIAELL